MARPEALSRAALLLAACGYASGFALAPSRLSMALVSSKNSAFSRTAPEVLRRSNPRSQARHGIAGMRSMASSSLTRFMAEPELPSEEIISAVERAGGRVTVADVASGAGVSLDEAKRSLTALAQLAEGDLEVSSEGQLVYSFRGVRSTLLAKSSKARAMEQWKKVEPVLFYLMRVSFGVALIASIAIVFTGVAF